jgi:RND family efflux transporter MFP subunit
MRKFLTRRNIILAAVAVLIGFLWWNGRQTAAKKAESNVVVKEVTRGDVELSLSVSGEIKAEQQATLNYFTSGRVAYMGVKVGDKVKKWQLLAYLDPGDLEAAEQKAHYAYISADAYAKLIEDQVKGHESDESFTLKNTRVAAQTARDSAYDTWLSAQRAVKNSKLVAPFAGIVTNVTSAAVGDTASVTDGVTIVDPKSLYFSAEVDETDVGKLNGTETVEVEMDAFSGQKFSATIGDVGFVSTLSSTGATVYPVKLYFPEGDLGKLRVGMNGDAKIILEVKKDVLRVPVEAVVDGYVTLAEGEQKVAVETGLEGDIDVEITKGLSEGEKVIINR